MELTYLKPNPNQNNELRDAKVPCRAEGDSKAGDTSVDLSLYIGHVRVFRRSAALRPDSGEDMRQMAGKQNEFKWGRKTDKDKKKIDLS